MRVCGIEIKASDAIFVVLDKIQDSYTLVDTGVKKIKLRDTHSSIEVQRFKETIHLFIKNNKIDKIAIKKRNTKGQFSGGAASFKIEGIIQLSEDSEVVLLAPATISSTLKKKQLMPPGHLFAYQKGAWETAFTLLQTV